MTSSQYTRPSVSSSNARKRILVAISGGQGSAVTAALLKSQGHDVIGVHFQVYDAQGPVAKRFGSRCCLTKNVEAAQEVCAKLDVTLHVMSLEDEFQDKVVDYFVHEILQCRAANPCFPCNREIRFGSLFKMADELGCDLVSTGHHAQVFHEVDVNGVPVSARLTKAVNAEKDQSYLLFGLNQKQLLRIIMPLGGFQDVMIARLAQEFNLPAVSAGKPREVCLSQVDSYRAFVEAHSAPTLRAQGIVKMLEGTPVTDHPGLHNFQVGQKLKLPSSVKDADQYAVINFDPPTHTLFIGNEKYLYHAEARASHATWVHPLDQMHGLKCRARFSALQAEELPCRLTFYENETVRVEFEKPIRGLAQGQAIVFYEGDEVLGGAFIDHMGSLPREKLF